MTGKPFRSELSLPAGSLQCAMRAFEGGADSVYLGLKSFSARKGAVNFSFEDLRKLKQLCLDKGKKFYITLNTLVTDSQLGEVENLLHGLEYIEPDGVIVQDLGIASVIRERYPSLPLHGSTQLAVHTVGGVRELQDLGFARVVLARELSLEEIINIRKACPDVELKVFIHGALCFGFSGLCMASEVLTGRSANCGECAQICRSWFSCKGFSDKFWPFSMRDLCIGKDVLKYSAAGIDSLKIEGRMKSPEYVYHCAKYYSDILDGKDPDHQAMKTAFLRQETEGFLNTGTDGNRNGKSLTCPDYPSHRGIRIGTIRKVMKNRAEILFERPAALRDGLLVISRGQSAGFALSGIEDGRSFVAQGQIAQVDFPSSAFDRPPAEGCPVMCTSRHNSSLPLLSENIPLYRKPVDLKIYVSHGCIEINGRKFEISVSQARKEADVEEILRKTFRASGESLFTCGNPEYENRSSWESPFLPLSQLKEIRRAFYACLDEEFEKFTAPSIPVNGIPITEIDPKAPGVVRMDAVMFNEEEYLNRMDRILEENPQTLFGLNNIAQLGWAKKHPQARVFADFFLYVKNTPAWELLNKEASLSGRVSHMNENEIPLFISRVCLRHSSLGLPCKGCTRDNTYTLSQNGKTFTAHCKNCITSVYLNS